MVHVKQALVHVGTTKSGQRNSGDVAGFKDAHLMALIGFGLLATFLGKYGHSSLALNLLAISFVLQYYIMISGMLQTMGELIRINIIR